MFVSLSETVPSWPPQTVGRIDREECRLARCLPARAMQHTNLRNRERMTAKKKFKNIDTAQTTETPLGGCDITHESQVVYHSSDRGVGLPMHNLQRIWQLLSC